VRRTGGLVFSRDGLKQFGLANGELNGVRGGRDQRSHALIEVFDAGKEAALVKEPVIDGDIETAAGRGVEQSIQTECFHER
jgi:hypothetical protein